MQTKSQKKSYNKYNASIPVHIVISKWKTYKRRTIKHTSRHLIVMSTVEGQEHKSMRYYTSQVYLDLSIIPASHILRKRNHGPRKLTIALKLVSYVLCWFNPLCVKFLWPVILSLLWTHTKPQLLSWSLTNLWLTCEETMQNLGIKQLHISL